jgi:hypothetical protein
MDWLSAIDRHKFAEPAARLLHRILRHTRKHGARGAPEQRQTDRRNPTSPKVIGS